jgi:hypothetical protein
LAAEATVERERNHRVELEANQVSSDTGIRRPPVKPSAYTNATPRPRRLASPIAPRVRYGGTAAERRADVGTTACWTRKHSQRSDQR